MTDLELARYLERIHYTGALTPTKETLFDLQLAHLLAVPFENLSIHAGETIQLCEDWLFDKIVARRRGGFCYELNGLFAQLLRQLGFKVTMLSGHTIRGDGSFGAEFDHLVLMVELAERWLVEVGFGDSARQPLLIDSRQESAQYEFTYRIIQAGERLILMRRAEDGEWTTQYRFTLAPRELTEYQEMCRYHQTSPQSSFTQRQICTVARRDGRVTLSGMRRIETIDGKRAERLLANAQEYAAALAQDFGIVM